MIPSTDDTTCFALSGLGIARVSGADAETFLQGQFSNDITDLSPDNGHQLTAYCNPKGRMLALFHLLREADAAYVLLAPREVLNKVLPRLKMFVMRSAVTIELDQDTQTYGVQTSNISAAGAGLAPGARIFPHSLDPGRFLVLASASPTMDSEAEQEWNQLDIEQNLPQVYAQTHEALIPQSANLDIVGGVNFKKGCYPGQEIIARIKYRGKPKTRMIGASIKTQDNIEIGQPVFIEGPQESRGAGGKPGQDRRYHPAQYHGAGHPPAPRRCLPGRGTEYTAGETAVAVRNPGVMFLVPGCSKKNTEHTKETKVCRSS